MNAVEFKEFNRRTHDLFEAVKAPDGGFTVSADLSDPGLAFGWMVSVQGYEQEFSEDDYIPFVQQIKLYSTLVRTGASAGTHIGGWNHKGKIVVDLSKHVIDRDLALALARANNQLAIYEIHTGKVIMMDNVEEIAELEKQISELSTRITIAQNLLNDPSRLHPVSEPGEFIKNVLSDDIARQLALLKKVEELRK